MTQLNRKQLCDLWALLIVFRDSLQLEGHKAKEVNNLARYVTARIAQIDGENRVPENDFKASIEAIDEGQSYT